MSVAYQEQPSEDYPTDLAILGHRHHEDQVHFAISGVASVQTGEEQLFQDIKLKYQMKFMDILINKPNGYTKKAADDMTIDLLGSTGTADEPSTDSDEDELTALDITCNKWNAVSQEQILVLNFDMNQRDEDLVQHYCNIRGQELTKVSHRNVHIRKDLAEQITKFINSDCKDACKGSIFIQNESVNNTIELDDSDTVHVDDIANMASGSAEEM